MTLTGTSARFELLASADLTSANVSGSAQIGTAATAVVYDASPNIAYSLVMFISAGESITLDFTTGLISGEITGVNQVETATVVAAGGITTNGTCNVIFTDDALVGSPFTIPVTLTTTTHTTAALIAAEIRSAIAANAIISEEYTIGGGSAAVTATRINKRNDRSSLNIAIPAGLGITAALTSANTTAGVGEVKATRISGLVWDQTDHEGFTLEEATKLYSVVVRSEDNDGATVDISGAGYSSGESTPFALCRFNSAGNHPWNGLDVTFATDTDVTLRIDIHAGT